jgi:hypothetical protein
MFICSQRPAVLPRVSGETPAVSFSAWLRLVTTRVSSWARSMTLIDCGVSTRGVAVLVAEMASS